MTDAPLHALDAPSPAGLSPEEKLVWILGDMMNAAENYFGAPNPKRLGHINSAAIRIIDEVLNARALPEAGEAPALIEAYFSAVFEMVDPKIFADDLMECLSAKGFKIVARDYCDDPFWRSLWDAAP